MEKQIFKTGDRVFVYGFGWGVIQQQQDDIGLSLITFKTGNEAGKTQAIHSSLVSFTEYTLQNFSQERPIDHYIGKWGVLKKIKTLKAIATMTLLGLKPTSKYHK